MKIAVNYIQVTGNSTDATDPSRGPGFWIPYHLRFVESYRRHPAGIPHELHVTLSGRPSAGDTSPLYEGLEPIYHNHDGSGRDIGGNQATACALDADLVLCLSTSSYIQCDLWLRLFADAFSHHGDGLYGPMGSYERRPHIRASVFACSAATFRAYPHTIDTYKKTSLFETGGVYPEEVSRCSTSWCFSEWFARQGKPVLMVTSDGKSLPKSQWRQPPNIFRRGNQSNCPIWDRHNDDYNLSDPWKKREHERTADGL